MAQPPFKIDSISIEPGGSGSRTIQKDSTTDALSFSDSLTGSLSLSALSGIRNISNVLIVGKSGSGAKYTTIQSALDAASVLATKDSTVALLVFPGNYVENLVLEKDGIVILGMGRPTITASVADAVVTVQASVSTTPKFLRLENIRLLNPFPGEECVKIVGGAGSEVGLDSISIVNCDVLATGAGSYGIFSDTANSVIVKSVNFSGSHSTASVRFSQTSDVVISGASNFPHCQFDYDSGGSQPSNFASVSTSVSDSTLSGNIQSTLVGSGVLRLKNCTTLGTSNLTLGGSESFYVTDSSVSAVAVNDSSTLFLRNSSRTTLSGTGQVAEDAFRGSVAFAGVSSVVVTFPVENIDDNYFVNTETELVESIGVVKTSANFTLSFSGAQNTTVNYLVSRVV